MSDATSLLNALTQIVGAKNVLTQSKQTEPYLTERRGLFVSQCLAVIKPASTTQISECVSLCHQHKTSIVPMGGNTGLCGGAVAHAKQIILSTERLNSIRYIDTENYSITVESGCILENIQQAAKLEDRLFPLSLGAQGSCQIGGNLATNAGGINVLHYGNARDLCLGIEVVLANGDVYSDLNGLRKDNTGYALKHLFIGAEGTLGIITAATLKLFPAPKETITTLIALPNLDNAIALYNVIRQISSDRVTTFELIPHIATEFITKHIAEPPTLFNKAYPWYMLVVIHSTREEPHLSKDFEDALERAYDDYLISDALVAQNIGQADRLLAVREKLVEVQKFEGASIKHDISVPISAIPRFIEQAAQTIENIVPGARPYPFGHLGDGNIHYNISQPEDQDAQRFMDKRAAINTAIFELVHQMEGSFSAEHGIGMLRTDIMPRYKGEVALAAMRSIKRALDPENIMNPGKVIGELDKPVGQ